MVPQALTKAKRFIEVKKGKSRAQMLDWFNRELGLDETPMLRLLGYTPSAIEKRIAAGATFEQFARAGFARATRTVIAC